MSFLLPFLPLRSSRAIHSLGQSVGCKHAFAEDPTGEMIALLDSMSETDAGLFRRMHKSGLYELMGTDEAFEFGLKLILSGIEQVIKEQEK